MTQKEINAAVEISLNLCGKDATIKALNTMFHEGLITADQAINLLDTLNK